MTLRPESSVSCAMDAYGEVVFPNCGNGAVVQRTPEELGIARTVKDERAGRLLPYSLKREDENYPDVGPGSLGRSGASKRVVKQTIRGVAVRMPACAVMGAELIEGFAAEEAGKLEDEKVANDFDMTNPVNQAIANADPMVNAKDLAQELRVPASRVYGVRSQLYREGKLQKPSKSQRQAARRGHKTRRTDEEPAAVQMGPARPLAQLALAPVKEVAGPAASGAVQMQLSEAEVTAIFAKLSAEQRAAFLGAGLKAALLT